MSSISEQQWLQHGARWVSLLESRSLIYCWNRQRDYEQHAFDDSLTLEQALIVTEYVDHEELSRRGQIALMQCFDLERHRYDREQPETYSFWLQFFESLQDAWLEPARLDTFMQSHASIMKCLEVVFETPTPAYGLELYRRLDQLICGAFYKYNSISPALLKPFIQPDISTWCPILDKFARSARQLGWAQLHKALVVLDLSEKYLARMDEHDRICYRHSLTFDKAIDRNMVLSEEQQQRPDHDDGNPYKDLIFEQYAQKVRKSISASSDAGKWRKKADKAVARMMVLNEGKKSRLRQLSIQLDSLKTCDLDRARKIEEQETKIRELRNSIGLDDIAMACLKEGSNG